MTDYSDSSSAKNSPQNVNVDHSAVKIAIIGGGLTGLFTATLLERAFAQQNAQSATKQILPQLTIFEKSRSVGRLASRYRTDSQTHKNWQWDFGAQFFTAKSAPFAQFIQPWLDSGLLQPWCAQVVDLSPAKASNQAPTIDNKEQWNHTQARYISSPKMTSWGRTLANELSHTTLHFKTRVAPLEHFDARQPQNASSQTQLFDEAGNSLGSFDWVICTAPNVQAIDLMAASGFSEQAQIGKPQMQACYTLMLGWDSAEQLPETLHNRSTTTASAWDVAYISDSPLDRLFVEHHKPARDALLPSVTIHARNDWSQAHVDEDIEPITAQLLAAAQQALNWDERTAPSQVDCHRWRYAATAVNKAAASGILVDSQQQWIVSGDWCAQGHIESCYLMADETAKTIIAVIDKMN